MPTLWRRRTTIHQYPIQSAKRIPQLAILLVSPRLKPPHPLLQRTSARSIHHGTFLLTYNVNVHCKLPEIGLRRYGATGVLTKLNVVGLAFLERIRRGGGPRSSA